MLKALKNELLLSGKLNIFCAVFVFGTYAFGLIIAVVILAFGEEVTYFPMGSLMAALGGLMAEIFYDGISFSTGFSLSASMGRCRLPKMVAHAAVALLRMLLAAAAVYLLIGLDAFIGRSFYPSLEVELNLREFISFGVVAAYVLVPVVVSLLVSAVKVRFGMRGWAVMYGLFLAICILGPRMVETALENPDLPLAKALAAVSAAVSSVMNPSLWVLVAVLAAAAVLFVAYRLLMRAQINID